MDPTDRKYFNILKTQVVRTMQKSHPEVPSNISDWRGEDISTFQVELRELHKESLSEKWFYTHIKTSNTKLPRIDTLNLLSRYTGYKSWDDFKYRFKVEVESDFISKDRSNRLFIIVPVIMLLVTLLFYLAVSTIYNKEYSFCFSDSESGIALNNRMIHISVLIEGESPHYYICDESGCFSLKFSNKIISFIVETPGYYSDTIVRRLNKYKPEETIKLRADKESPR